MWPFKKEKIVEPVLSQYCENDVNFLQELHKVHNDFEKEMEKIRQEIRSLDIKSHLKRVYIAALKNVIGDNSKIEVSNIYNGHKFKIIINDGTLRLTKHAIRTLNERFRSLIMNVEEDNFVILDLSIYRDPMSYETMKNRFPLFYQTIDMDDEDFELWFKLNF
jgi:hypothetical protein